MNCRIKGVLAGSKLRKQHCAYMQVPVSACRHVRIWHPHSRQVRHVSSATGTSSIAPAPTEAYNTRPARQHGQHVANDLHHEPDIEPAQALLLPPTFIPISMTMNCTAFQLHTACKPQAEQYAYTSHQAAEHIQLAHTSPSSNQQQQQQQQQQRRRPGKLPKQLHAVHQQVLADVRSKRLLQKGQKLLVAATSDQAGSCLVKVMTDISGVWDWQLVIAHLPSSSTNNSHGDDVMLTDGSQAADSRGSSEQQHAQHGASSIHMQLACTSQSGSEAWHEQLQEVAACHKCTAVVLPTTATDCAVQLLLSMLQVSQVRKTQQVKSAPASSHGLPGRASVQSAAGMQQQTSPAGAFLPAWLRPGERAGNVTVVQPLLGITEQQLRQFAAHQNLSQAHNTHVESTNQSHDARPLEAAGQGVDGRFIRNAVMPYLRTHFNPAVDVVLTRTAMLLHEDEQCLAGFLNESTASAATTAAATGSVNVQAAAAAARKWLPHSIPHTPATQMVSHFNRMQTEGQNEDWYMLSSNPWQTPQVDHIRHHVWHNLLRLQQQIGDVTSVLVAVSGGQDSLCLLWMVLSLQRELGWQVVVVHCDHCWRPDSAANALHVKAVCEQWGVPCHVRVAPEPPEVSTEARARTWRYSMLHKVAQQTGCELVLTGHTLTDQVETQLLNMCRGAGPAGLQALQQLRSLTPEEAAPAWQLQLAQEPTGQHVSPQKSWEPQQQVWAGRPLLGLVRSDTGFVCKRLNLPVYLDSTNFDVDVARRNRVRLELMPSLVQQFGCNLERRLATHASRATARAQSLDTIANVAAKASLLQHLPAASFDITAHLAPGPSCSITHTWALDRMLLHVLPAALQRRLVIKLLSTIPGLKTQVQFDKVEEVLQLVMASNRSSTGTLARVPLEGVLNSRRDPLVQDAATNNAVASVQQHQRCSVSAVVQGQRIVIMYTWSVGK